MTYLELDAQCIGTARTAQAEAACESAALNRLADAIREIEQPQPHRMAEYASTAIARLKDAREADWNNARSDAEEAAGWLEAVARQLRALAAAPFTGDGYRAVSELLATIHVGGDIEDYGEAILESHRGSMCQHCQHIAIGDFECVTTRLRDVYEVCPQCGEQQDDGGALEVEVCDACEQEVEPGREWAHHGGVCIGGGE